MCYQLPDPDISFYSRGSRCPWTKEKCLTDRKTKSANALFPKHATSLSASSIHLSIKTLVVKSKTHFSINKQSCKLVTCCFTTLAWVKQNFTGHKYVNLVRKYWSSSCRSSVSCSCNGWVHLTDRLCLPPPYSYVDTLLMGNCSQSDLWLMTRISSDWLQQEVGLIGLARLHLLTSVSNCAPNISTGWPLLRVGFCFSTHSLKQNGAITFIVLSGYGVGLMGSAAKIKQLLNEQNYEI